MTTDRIGELLPLETGHLTRQVYSECRVKEEFGAKTKLDSVVESQFELESPSSLIVSLESPCPVSALRLENKTADLGSQLFEETKNTDNFESPDLNNEGEFFDAALKARKLIRQTSETESGIFISEMI